MLNFTNAIGVIGFGEINQSDLSVLDDMLSTFESNSVLRGIIEKHSIELELMLSVVSESKLATLDEVFDIICMLCVLTNTVIKHNSVFSQGLYMNTDIISMLSKFTSIFSVLAMFYNQKIEGE